jgi:hypothetical protein
MDHNKHVTGKPQARLLRACSLAEFCWFCCLLPKDESLLRTERRDRLEIRKRSLKLGNALSCNGVAIFRG